MSLEFNGAFDRMLDREGDDSECDCCHKRRRTRQYAAGYYCAECIRWNEEMLRAEFEEESEA